MKVYNLNGLQFVDYSLCTRGQNYRYYFRCGLMNAKQVVIMKSLYLLALILLMQSIGLIHLR